MEESPERSERSERSGGTGSGEFGSGGSEFGGFRSDGRHRAVGAVFEPTRPVTRNRLVLMFLLGALVWLAAGVT